MEDRIEVNGVGYVRADSIGPKTVMDGHPYPVGKNVFIRTVTMYYVGKLVDVFERELVLEDAAWVADTGRFGDFLKTHKANEVEPFAGGRLVIGRGSIIDCSEWSGDLIRSQK